MIERSFDPFVKRLVHVRAKRDRDIVILHPGKVLTLDPVLTHLFRNDLAVRVPAVRAVNPTRVHTIQFQRKFARGHGAFISGLGNLFRGFRDDRDCCGAHAYLLKKTATIIRHNSFWGCFDELMITLR
jgi:hypothetical protein